MNKTNSVVIQSCNNEVLWKVGFSSIVYRQLKSCITWIDIANVKLPAFTCNNIWWASDTLEICHEQKQIPYHPFNELSYLTISKLTGYGTRTFQLLGLHSPPRKRTYFWQALMGWWVGTWQAVWSACQSGTGVGWVLVCGFLGLPSAGFEFSSFVFSFYCWPESVDGWIQTCPIPASGEHWGYWNNPNNPVYCFSLSCLQCK